MDLLKKSLLMSCALILLSCGSRKRVKNEQEKAVEIEHDIKRIDNSRIETNILTTKTENTTVFEPIDSEKPIIINSDTIANAKVTIGNSDTESQIAIREYKEIKESDNSKIKAEESSKNLQTEREGFNWDGLVSALKWLGLIIILIIIGWMSKRRSRQ